MNFLLFILKSIDMTFLSGEGYTDLNILTGDGAVVITIGLWIGAAVFFKRKLKWSGIRSKVYATVFVVVVWIGFVLVCMIIG